MKDVIYGWWLPPDISTHGAGIDQLIFYIHIFMFTLFFGWGVFFLYTLYRFRERPGHTATYEAKHFTFSTYLEAAVLGIELVLLFALAMPITLQAKTPPAEKDAFTVRIVAQQFAWNIHYPGPDGKFGRTEEKLVNEAAGNPIGLDRTDPDAKDDVVTINDFHFPVKTKILVKLSSKDVIHSFFIPVLRVKHDSVPGMVVPVWFEATQTGQFEIACAQLCGNSHYRMRGSLTVETPETYTAWMADQQKELNPEVAQ